MSIRIPEEEIPSFESLGLYQRMAYSWPYHPYYKLFELHMEMHFLDYKHSVLDIRVPIGEVIRKRWWDIRFRDFIHKELRGLKLSDYNYVPNEEVFFREHPDLREKWEAKRNNVVLIHSKKDRYGRARYDFDYSLKVNWMIKRKQEFMLRWIGLKTQPKTRVETRKKIFKYYSNSLLFCRHQKCWKERLKWFPLILLIWVYLQFYYKVWNTSAFDIYPKTITRNRGNQTD